MNPLDLQAAAPLFRRICDPVTGAEPFYEMLSHALVWTDELPDEPPSEWQAIRPVLRHRTCIILGEASEYEQWWKVAQSLFPNWVGFRHDRCTPTESLRSLYAESVREADRSLNRVFPPDDVP